MVTEVKFPQLGESVVEGTVTRWLKKVGDSVDKDEPLYEISTDKIDTEVTSPASGKIAEIKAEQGKKVAVGAVVALIEEGDGKRAPQPPPEGPAQEAPPVPEGEEEPEGKRPSRAPFEVPREKAAEKAPAQAPRERRAPAEPAPAPREARREQAAPAAPGRPVFEEGEKTKAVPMSPMRAEIAERVAASHRTAPLVTTVFEVDVSKIVALREKEKEAFERDYELRLSFMPFFALATLQGLRAFPALNASVDGGNLVFKKDIHLGIAVALQDGLIVPVVKHADEYSFVALTRTIHDLVERARRKELTVDDVANGTFTITNHGSFGSLIATPLIIQPQAGILGIGKIEERPKIVNGSLSFRSMCYVELSYDHRAIDGAMADQFLAKVKEEIEDFRVPMR